VGEERAARFGFGAFGQPFGVVHEGGPSRFVRATSARQRQGALGAGGADQDEAAAVGGVELVDGVEELDAVDGAVGGEVVADLVGDADGLGLLAQPDTGEVVLRVVGEAHGLSPLQKNSARTVITSQPSSVRVKTGPGRLSPVADG
jgi:hypothetical protein